MTQVNFYTLSSEEESSRLQFACRLCEKAVALGHQVTILSESESQQTLLDDLLWQFKPASFIPHVPASDSAAESTPVVLCLKQAPKFATDVLINLHPNACEQHAQFKRINEILTADQDSLAAGRVNYRFYQSQGYQPETHKL